MYGAFGRDFAHGGRAAGDGGGDQPAAVGVARRARPRSASTSVDRAGARVDFRAGGRPVPRRAMRWQRSSLPGSRRTVAEIAEVFDARGVCWGPYQTFRSSSRKTGAAANRTRCSATSISRASVCYGCPAAPPHSRPASAREPRPAPLLGEHTDVILEVDLGLSTAEIAETPRQRDRGRPTMNASVR